jgi:Sulfotransferase family
MMARPKVVSIMGIGHSGSTVLDVVLGDHPNITGVGELHKLPRSGWVRNDNRRCACGSPIHECPYWSEVFRGWTRRVGADGLAPYIALQNTFERSRSRWPRLLFESRRRSARFCTYIEMTAALYEAIREVSGSDTIIDSSKPAIRNYALLQNDRLDVRVIHLIRDGRAVVWSKMKRRSRDVEAGIPTDQPATPSWRTSLGWVLTNLESEWVAKQAGPDRILRLTYELFVERPLEALERIGRLLEEDLSCVGSHLMEGRAMDAGHTVGGNRLRMSGHVVLRPDFEWRTKLPPEDDRTFWHVAGWLARRYGYAR